MESELRMADYVAAALDAQMRALVAEREALDEWALRLGAAKQENALGFEAETRALFLEREALDTRARHLVEKEAMRREVFDSMVRQAFLLHPHVDNDQENVGMRNMGDKKRKASFLKSASAQKNASMKLVLDDDGQPAAKKKTLPQLEKQQTLDSEHSNWWCDVCKLDCKEASAMASHLAGRKHKRMVKTSSEEPPPSDGKSLSDIKSLKSTSDIKEPLEKEEEASLLQASELRCALCQVNCPNSKALLAHQAGKKHLRRMSTEAKKEASRVDTAQEIDACPLEEGKGVNDECPSLEATRMSNLDDATLSRRECKNDGVDNGKERGNCVSLDLESPLAAVSMPEGKNKCMDSGLENGTCASLE